MRHSQTYDLPFYIEKFLRFLKRDFYSEETVIGYTKDLDSFNQYIYHEYNGKILVRDISRHDLLDYLTYLHEVKRYKQSSSQRHLSTLKSFYKFLVYEMNFDDNVASKIKHKKMYTPLPELLTKEEVEHFLQTAKAYSFYFYVLYSMIYYTGSRITPIIEFQKKNVDFVNRKLYFPKVKGGRDLYLPIHELLFPLLEQFLAKHPAPTSPYVFHSPTNPERHIVADTVRIHMRKIKKAAGYKEKRITPHILRHCMATHLTIAGVSQRYLTELLGHVDLRSAYRYQQLNVEDLRDSINRI